MKVLKVLLALFGIIILLVAGAAAYVKIALPDTGKPQVIRVSSRPERIENGRYLANHVTVCMDCHSSRDWDLFAGPMKKDGFGAGGEVFNEQMGFPGTFYAPNITPYALKNWTDGEVLHAITTGVNKEGRALFPLMAAHRFGKMDKEDIYDIIAYLRTLSSVEKDIPRSKADFPVNFIMNTMPRKAAFQKKPAAQDTVLYGAYLANAAGCVDCHSQTDKGSVIPGTEFGGGMEFKMPTGIVRSPNITADQSTGIGGWTKTAFVLRFKSYADSSYHAAKVENGSMNTPMPWGMYAGMKEKDLEAIYAYLNSIKPMQHQVLKYSPHP